MAMRPSHFVGMALSMINSERTEFPIGINVVTFIAFSAKVRCTQAEVLYRNTGMACV